MKALFKTTIIYALLLLLLFGCDSNQKKETEISNYEKQYQLLLTAKPNVVAKADSTLLILEQTKSLVNSGIKKYEYGYYIKKGLYFWTIGQTDSSIFYHSKVAKLQPDTSNFHVISDALSNCGIAYIVSGQLDSAQYYIDKLLKLETDRDNKKGIASANYYLSAINIEKGLYSKALENQMVSIKNIEEIKDTSELIDNYNSLGVIYYKQKMYKEAKTAYMKAADLCNASNEYISYSPVCNNLYNVYNIESKYDSAAFYLNSALSKVNKKSVRTYGTLLINKGMIFLEKKQVDSAEFYIRQALNLPNAKNVINNFIFDKNLGLIKTHRKEYDSAQYFLNSALQNAQKKKNTDRIADCYRSIAFLDSARGDYKSAYINQKRYKVYYDSVFNNENQKRMDILKMEYEVEKKDFQLRELDLKARLNTKTIKNQTIVIILGSLLIVALLLLVELNRRTKKKIKSKNQEILKQNQQLKELVSTKDKFFSIISHDLRSPFNSLLLALDILIDDYGSLSEPEKRELLKSLRHTSKESFDLLNLLLEWSRSQRGMIKCNPKNIPCHNIIQKCIEMVSSRSEQKGQTIINHVPKDAIVFADDKLLTTIFNNLLSNAVKFSNIDGTITVEMEDKTNEVIFSVTDNGIGIPQDKADNIFNIDSDFKRKGTSNESGTGLGLIIVKEFVLLHKGRTWVKSAEGMGSVFYFSLPKP